MGVLHKTDVTLYYSLQEERKQSVRWWDGVAVPTWSEQKLKKLYDRWGIIYRLCWIASQKTLKPSGIKLLQTGKTRLALFHLKPLIFLKILVLYLSDHISSCNTHTHPNSNTYTQTQPSLCCFFICFVVVIDVQAIYSINRKNGSRLLPCCVWRYKQ